MKMDWHIHSTFSDGQQSVDELIINAERIGLESIAITDHFDINDSSLYYMRDKKEEDDEDNDFEILLPSQQPSPYDKVIEKETLDEVKNKILKTLSKLEVEVLGLYLKGYSYSEISSKSGLSEKSIDNALTRIKSKLSFLKK